MKSLFRLASMLFVLVLAFSAFGSITPKVSALDAVEIVNVESPGVVAPGQSICFKVTVKVNSGQLLESRGDMLRNTDGNLFGHWPHIAVVGTVNTGGTYTFTCYGGMVAPMAEGNYESKWRVWQNAAYVGQEAVVHFEVKIGGGGGGGSGGICGDTPAQSGIDLNDLQVGDIILTRNDRLYDLTLAALYGGYWSHALVVSDITGGMPYVSESYANPPRPWNNQPGVINRPLKDSGVCTSPDVVILRVKTDANNRNKAGVYTKQQIGDPYNWQLWDKAREDQFYCSQLAWAAYQYPSGINLDSNLSMVGILGILDSKIVTPDDIYFSSERELVDIAVKQGGGSFKRAVIYALSPVDLYLVNPNGQAIGIDPSTGAEVNEIPGAFYSGADAEPEFISVQDLSGDWELQVSGTGTGDYTLVVEDISAQHSISSSVGTTEVGVLATYDVNLDSSDSVLTPQDQTPPTTTISLNGTQGLNNWFVTPVEVTLSAIDNEGGVGVRNTEYSLDNGITWTVYTTPFVLNDGVHQLLYRSIDHVNNLEIAQQIEIKIDTVPPVVNTWVDQQEYTRVQPFIAHFSGYDPEPGSGLASLLALFNNQPVIDGQVIDLFWLPLGTYTLTATGEDNAGWVTTNSKTITLIATIPSLQQAVNRLCAENYITKQGTCTSLSQKLASALAAQQRGQNKTAVNILLAFQNELKAQKGKAVTVQAYDLLMMDSNYVIQVLGGK